MEVWKDIPDWESFYQVSTRGRVKSLPRVVTRSNGSPCTVTGGLLKPGKQTSGHLMVVLRRPGVSKTCRVASLVLLAFVGQPPTDKEACHKNGKHTDNRLSNLMYGTHTLNMQQKVNHGFHHLARTVKRSDGKVYKSCRRASVAIGLHPDTVGTSLRRGSGVCGGYSFEYV